MATLVGKKAPEFTAQAVIGNAIVDNFSLSKFRGQYVLLFFYPLDFTFVCPTELHAFQEKLEEFEARNAQVIGCSIDSPYCHLAWLKTPKAEGGIEGIKYPLLSDIHKEIAKEYDVLHPGGIAYRGLFLIDRQGIVRHQMINDLPLGRCVEETLRILDALLFHEEHGEVCPANWNHGARGMKPTQEGLKEFFVPAQG